MEEQVKRTKRKWIITISLFCLVVAPVGFVIWAWADYWNGQNNFDTREDLRTVARAMLLYADKHGGTLPPLQNVDAFKQAVLPYIDVPKQSWTQFASRVDHVPYQTNSALSGKKMADIPAPERQIILYQDQARGLWGQRWVLFLNGQPRLIDGKNWPHVKQVARLP
ncbi:MAG: hypothetical protein M3Y13_00420 [Armatimonadota bacterium]|nr:hypothetical protein [Armatimonadota bacterium]